MNTNLLNLKFWDYIIISSEMTSLCYQIKVIKMTSLVYSENT